MTDIDKLKPCPCCKSTKLRANEGFDECDNLECWIECEECSFAAERKDSAQDAESEWNTSIAQSFRSTINAHEEAIEELQNKAADTIAAQSARIEELEKQVEAIKGLDEWEPTHRNKRTGAICQLVREDIANERVTEFDEMAVLYTGADGTKYVTSYDDFFDRSFEALPTPPKEGGVK